MTITIDDYPYRPRPRRLSPKLESRIAAGERRYRSLLLSFLRVATELRQIPVQPDSSAPDLPHWTNDWLPALDAISIYGLIALLRPRTYIEIGSGYSTKFARLAITNHRLATRIVSIDPMPRADVDSLCDTAIRSSLEDADPSVLAKLGPGDVLFVDSSHRAFQNSDVTVFFTEILPGLTRGVVYGIHDIFLPFDYGESTLSPAWPDDELPESREAIARRFQSFVPRFYNEQYMLAAWLLGGAGGDEILLPCAWVSSRYDIAKLLAPIWKAPGFKALSPWGGAFWARRGSENRFAPGRWIAPSPRGGRLGQ